MAYDPTSQTGEKRKRLSAENPEIVNAYVSGRRIMSPDIHSQSSQQGRPAATVRPPLITVNDPLISIAPSLRRYLQLVQSQESLAMNIDQISILQTISDAFERYFNRPVKVVSAPYTSISWLDLLHMTANTPTNQLTETPSDVPGMKRLNVVEKVFDIDAQDYTLLTSGLTPGVLLNQVNIAEEELRTLTMVEKTLNDIEYQAVETIREAQSVRDAIIERRQRLAAGSSSIQQIAPTQPIDFSTRLPQPPPGPLPTSKSLHGLSSYRTSGLLSSDRPRSPYPPVQSPYDVESSRSNLDYGTMPLSAMSSLNQPVNVLIPARSHYRSQMSGDSSRLGSGSLGPTVTSAGRLSAGQSPQASRIVSPFTTTEDPHPYNTRAGSSRVSNINQLMNTQVHPLSLPQEYAPAIPSNLSMHEASPEQAFTSGPPGTRMIPPMPRSAQQEPEMQDPEPFRNAIQDRLKQYEKYEKITPPCDRCRRTNKTCTRLLAACGPCTKKHSKCEWKKVTQEELSQPVVHEIPPQEDSPTMTPRDRRSGLMKLENVPSLASGPTASSLGEGSKSAESEMADRLDFQDESEEAPRRRRRIAGLDPSAEASPSGEVQSEASPAASSMDQPERGSPQDPT